MNILLLSPYPEKIIQPLIQHSDVVVCRHEPIDPGFLAEWKIDRIVSYGYRHILRDPIPALYHHRIINLHISMLPWNRGADPTFWSVYENTPKGVSIHYIDAGIDTGDLLIQKEVPLTNAMTLLDAYLKMKREIEELFAQSWPLLRENKIIPFSQSGTGSHHRLKDKTPFFNALPQGEKTFLGELESLGRKNRTPQTNH